MIWVREECVRSALVHLVKSCPHSQHSFARRFTSSKCKVFGGPWPESGSRLQRKEKKMLHTSKVFSCIRCSVCAESYCSLDPHFLGIQRDVYIDIHGRKLMEKSVHIGQMVAVCAPFSDECHHLFKDFVALVENYVLPTPTAIKTSQSLLFFSNLRSYFFVARLPQGPCSLACRRRCRRSCRGRLGACTSRSRRFVCAPRSPTGGCPASGP